MESESGASLRYRILGPLEVWRDGREVRLGGERQRALLALLLVRANELVTAETLVDELSGTRRSDSALNALRVAVSRLRQALGGDRAAGVLATGPGGYVLRVDPEQVDAARFEGLLNEGRGELAAGQPEQGARRLREALELWRGAPLSDLSLVEGLQPEIRRLEGLRLSAVMERIDAELALGGGGELVGELEALVVSEPLQERLRGQLMRALYRAGRQADALAVHRQMSELLRDELGLEPSRGLQDLEREILRQAPALDPPPRPAHATAGNLPRSATPFLGRVRELGEITALIGMTDVRLLTLTGAGGIGKTRLALRAAEALCAEYRDGVWFVGFADISDPELISATICQALGLPQRPGLTPIEQLCSWLSKRELLLVLDNLEHLAVGTTVLGELLASCENLAILVTSRESLHLAGERHYEVPVLDRDDAVELLTTCVQAIKPDIGFAPELAEAICERLDCLPLAIELAAARTRVLPAIEILARLERRLPLLTRGPRDAPVRQRTLRATINWSYELLDPQAQQLFAGMAVFAGGCTLAAAEAVCDAELDRLQTLVERSLIRSDGTRFWMLQTLREYALERLEATGEAEAEAVRRAHAGWLIQLLEAERLGHPGWPDERSRGRVAPERDNFRAALEWASSRGEIEILARLASSLVGVWITDGQLHEATRWIPLTLEHAEQCVGTLRAQVLSAARCLARYRGDYAGAVVLGERALALWREVGDPEGIGRELVSCGYVRHLAGDLAGGRTALEQAIVFAREHQLTRVLADALLDLADLAIHQGELDEGRSLCEESLAVSGRTSLSAGLVFINLAYIAAVEGQHAQAETLAREALGTALRHGDLLVVAGATITIAWPLAAQGQVEQSARLLGAGMEFLETAGAGRDWMDEACELAVREILDARLESRTVQDLLDEGRGLALEAAARSVLRG